MSNQQLYSTGTVDTITEVLPGTHTPMPIHITVTKTSNIRDHLSTEAFQLTQAVHNFNQHINQPGRLCTKIHHDPGNPTVIHTLSENSRVTMNDPQPNFYSSDDQSSNLEEDSDHLS